MNSFSNLGNRSNFIIPDLNTVSESLNSFDLGEVDGAFFTLNTFDNGWTLNIDKDNELVLEIDSSWDEYYPSKLSKLFEYSPKLYKCMYDIFVFLKEFHSNIILGNSTELLALRLTKYYGDSYYLDEGVSEYTLTLFNVDNDVKYLEESIEFIKSTCKSKLVNIYQSSSDIVVILKK